jgi:hypothetical protein
VTNLRVIPVDAQRKDWPRLVADRVNKLTQSVQAMEEGMKDTKNSTTTALASAATYTGEWVQNNHEHIAVNCLSDTDGTLYIDFSIDGTSALTTFTKEIPIYANSSQFDALIKMPGRYHRVRFVNSASAQTTFGILTSTGQALFPFAVSDRDAPNFAASTSGGAITATTWAGLVDLSDRANYPHHFTGRIDLYSAFFFVDKGNNTIGATQIGIITRIDGTDADVEFVQGVSFDNATDNVFVRDRIFDTPIRCGQTSGSLNDVATGFKETAITALNTGITITGPNGTFTPAVGDMVVKYDYTSGASYTAAVSCQYATSASAA